MNNSDVPEYDGFYFLPGNEEHEYEISFFNFNEDRKGQPVDNTQVGFMYHVALFRQNEENRVEFDETFEAIFSDPLTYIRNLVGLNLYGTFVKKTEKSKEWFDNYLTKALDAVTITNSKKVMEMAKSISEN